MREGEIAISFELYSNWASPLGIFPHMYLEIVILIKRTDCYLKPLTGTET